MTIALRGTLVLVGAGKMGGALLEGLAQERHRRGAEVGDGTVEATTIPLTLQAIDMLANHNDLLEMYCECIVKNKSIGIYDGAYKCVELATGKKWTR